MGHHGRTMTAILWGIATAACWAFSVFFSSRSTRMIGQWSVLAWIMLVGLVASLPFASGSGTPSGLTLGAAGWLMLAALGNVEARVPDQAFQEAGLSPKGELFAMMLDVKRTWDDLVTRFAPDPARVFGASVTFAPGARTAWHTHPLGQTLIVTAGCGRAQSWGGPIQIIRPGDVVWFAPGEKHWHGAAPTTAMTHIALVEVLDGRSADWLEHVSEGQYQAAVSGG